MVVPTSLSNAQKAILKDLLQNVQEAKVEELFIVVVKHIMEDFLWWKDEGIAGGSHAEGEGRVVDVEYIPRQCSLAHTASSSSAVQCWVLMLPRRAVTRSG